MSELSEPVPVARVRPKVRAQQWGATAVTFILSGTATGICALLGFVLWPVTLPAAVACTALAAVFFVIFAAKSLTIVRWWIVLAQRDAAAKSGPRDADSAGTDPQPETAAR